MVWSEVKYNYPMWHRLSGLDWDGAFRERLAEVLPGQPDWDYYRVLQAFAALVRDSHVGVWMPAHLREAHCSPSLALWPLGERYVVIGFAPDLASDLGIALGDEVVALDGVGVGEYAAARVAPYQSSPTPHHLHLQVARSLLAGPRGTAVEVQVRRPEGKEFGCRLARDPAGERAAWTWYEPLAPANPVTARDPVTARTVGPGVGLMALRTFGYDGVVDDFDRELADLGPIEALILDLRTNGGGNSGWSDAIISRLVQEPLAGMRERRAHYSPALRSWHQGENGTGITWVEERMSPLEPGGPVSFHGPLALLTNAATHSAAEDFVGPLKTGGRARTVGGTTAGSTGNPLQFGLPGAGGFSVCTRYMLLPDGEEFIGLGIPADVPVSSTPGDLAAGTDPVLEQALTDLGRRPE